MNYKIMDDSRGYSEINSEYLVLVEAEQLLSNLQFTFPQINFWIEEQYQDIRQEAMFFKDKTNLSYE